MFPRHRPGPLLLLLLLTGLLSAHAGTAPLSVDRLRVIDLDEEPHAVFSGDARDIVVLFFIAPECPVSNRSIPTMRALAAEFATARVRFVGVYAEPDELPANLRRHATEFQIDFPLRIDRQHALVRLTNVTRTPEAVVADGLGTLLYRGRIDDRFVDFGRERQRATREDVREVLLALRSGQRPPFRATEGFGCTLSQPVPTR
jgi:thiol-disulfide isomerase/thioredoxin